MSMLLFTSTSPSRSDFTDEPPVVVWDGLTYGQYKDERDVDIILDVPHSVRSANGSWWMDVLLVKGGGSDLAGKGPNEVALYKKRTCSFSMITRTDDAQTAELTRFLPKRRVRKEKKLIGGDETANAVDEEPTDLPQQIVAHWSRNLTLTVVSAGGIINLASLPPILAAYYSTAPTPEGSPKAYYPPVFPNDFWLLRENMMPINETSESLPLHINYQAVSGMKFQLLAMMTQSMDQAAAQQGGGAEMDEVKRMLTETNPWLLGTTVIVTILHMLFEFLAFSSDVMHWRKKDKDLVGVSLNTILTNCVVQLVILLYLQDSSEETSFMILFGQGM